MVYPGQLHYTDYSSKVNRRPIDDFGRRLRVVCVGAGISGITSAIRFNQHLGEHIDFKIYEKNEDFGGVWLENRYPGVACDIPAPCFTWPFEDNPGWSSYYASGEEINDYVKRVAYKYQVDQYVKFKHYVTQAKWDEDRGLWKLTVKNMATAEEIEDEAEVLIMAWGMLNNWEFPKIPGLHDFKGPYMHTADYDTNFDPTDKVVALVGGGSTGVQVLPGIQTKARKVKHYMRSQNWIAPVGFGAGELEKRGALEKGNFEYTSDERTKWSRDPESYHAYRRQIEDGIMAYMAEDGFKYGSDIQKTMEADFRATMKRKLASRPDILKTLLPDFPPGCRRLVPGPGYLDAVVKDNVQWIPEGIDRVVENGIVTSDGVLHECDAIIWATGFICDFRSRFPVIGKDGISWNDVMDPEPESYLGVAVDKMPNCFLYFGPNCAPGAGNAFLCSEWECEFMISCTRKLLRDRLKSMCIRPERVKQYTSYVNEYLKTTIFGQPCKSWFKRGDPTGRNIAYWPGNALNQAYALKNPRWEDFEYTFLDELAGNPMAYLGNGYTIADYDGSSRTTYLEKANIDFPPIPKPRTVQVPSAPKRDEKKITIDQVVPVTVS